MDLEARALEQFDSLVKNGELFWKENEVRIVHAEPFNASNVSFKFTIHLAISVVLIGAPVPLQSD